jgi:uncharacterized protein YjbI with pentapeptide repeats
MTDTSLNIPHILSEHTKWCAGNGGARADLAGADLTGAYLARAYLARANLTGANLAGAYLADAYLTGANLTRADLTGANLADAYLTRAYLARANLADAYLTGANLADAYLTGANLTGANLAGANLTGAKYLIDGGQRLDGYRFVGWIKDGAVMIRAGCRNRTLAEYREHNAKRENAALRDETTAILDHIERVATIRELLK